jgi:6-phosphofructokinase 1
VPKTIDNDLPGTDITFGFQTAVATATDALDKLHSTAAAHERVMVVEVMGRDAGWIALYAGIAGSADVILIPELPFDMNIVAEKILRRQRRGRPFSIVCVAEGAKPKGGSAVFAEAKDDFHEKGRLGGISAFVAAEIERLTGKETRTVVLGHLQRGGIPVTADRLLALRLGTAATRFLAETNESGLVAVDGREIRLIPLSEAVGIRLVPKDSQVLQTGRDLGLCFGDESPGTFLSASVLPGSH